MDKERLIVLLDVIRESAQGWIADAEMRDEWNEVYYYQGQLDTVNEIKAIIGEW